MKEREPFLIKEPQTPPEDEITVRDGQVFLNGEKVHAGDGGNSLEQIVTEYKEKVATDNAKAKSEELARRAAAPRPETEKEFLARAARDLARIEKSGNGKPERRRCTHCGKWLDQPSLPGKGRCQDCGARV